MCDIRIILVPTNESGNKALLTDKGGKENGQNNEIGCRRETG